MNWKVEEQQEKVLSRETVHLFRKKLLPYILKYKKLFLVSLVFVITTTLTSLIIPWLLGYTVDHILIPKVARLLIPIALLFLGIDLLHATSMTLQNYTLSLLGQGVLHDLRQNLLKQYQFYPIKEFNKTSVGRLVTRLVNDTYNLQDLFTSGLALALGNISMILGIIIWLVILHPSLGLVCISVFPCMILVARFFGKRMRKALHESRSALSKLNAYLAENISGMWIIQLFNKKRIFRMRFNETSDDYTAKQWEVIRNFAYFQPSITVLSSLSMSLLIWYGGFRAMEATITLGLLVSFMSYLQALYAPMRDITEKYNLFVSAMTSCERIFEFMERPTEFSALPSALPNDQSFSPLHVKGAIHFKNVWFKYDPNQESWILKNINFEIKPGEKIGLVGQTGAGKTTISTLLLRFYDIQKGSIFIDGKDIQELDKMSLRKALGYIQQEPFLFSGTIADNLFLWESKNEEVFKKLPAFIRAPFESETLSLKKEIYEKGANLSTGEKQIISFVRALLQEPQVLILDEATAHVDLLTEKWIEDVAKETFKEKTVFIIAHRLATLRSVDRILVLHHGELVESGTHFDLLHSRGIYYKLYEIQSRKSELYGQGFSSVGLNA